MEVYEGKELELYHEIRYGLIGILLNLPERRVGKSISVGEYKLSRRFIGFN